VTVNVSFARYTKPSQNSCVISGHSSLPFGAASVTSANGSLRCQGGKREWSILRDGFEDDLSGLSRSPARCSLISFGASENDQVPVGFANAHDEEVLGLFDRVGFESRFSPTVSVPFPTEVHRHSERCAQRVPFARTVEPRRFQKTAVPLNLAWDV
jgi:hypothetical protein